MSIVFAKQKRVVGRDARVLREAETPVLGAVVDNKIITMKFTLKKNLALVIIVGILFLLVLNFYQKEVKNFFYLISSPFQKTLWKVGDNVSDFFETITERKALKKENEELKLKNQELLAQIALLKELRKENEVLREALNIGLQKEFKLALAEVIGKDISEDLILINKGSEDGILKDMPVVTQGKVLLGKIGEVYKNFSKVILLSNQESTVLVKVEDGEIKGVVKGEGNFKILLDNIPLNQEIKEGDLVVTAALGGNFPKGLLVGQVKEVKKSDVEPFQQAEILPFFDIKELEIVFIITNF